MRIRPPLARRGRFVALVVGLALGGVACGGGDTAGDDTAGSKTTGSDTTAPAAGEASTTASSALTAAGVVAGADPEVDKVVAAYTAVFDSAVAFDAKATHLAEAEALRPTVDAYAEAGGRFGGIKLVPTAVAINGDEAAVTYDVLFGTTTQYRALSGTAVREAGSWRISRDEFCSFMASARTPCPTS